TLKQVNALTYVQQILSEGLRLWPTAPALGLYPYEDEIVGGKYKLKKGTFVNVLLLMLHRDPKVWKDPEVFDPDRFAPEEVAKRPIHAYKPFGNGQRACIGRQFAMQEATLVIGMILQRFQLFDHTNYQLKIKESLSIKPDGFRMKVKPRPDVVRGTGGTKVEAEPVKATPKRASHGTKALVLYGSNLGTTEEIARHMARTADLNGFDTALAPLDDYTKSLPKDGVVLIASASYNGKPPDNATRFLDWVESCAPGDLEGVHYSVFGCGHSDWVATFQDTPRAIDAAMERAGATRIHERAEGDAKHDIDQEFDTWVEPLWAEVGKALGLDVDFGDAVEASALYSIEYLDGAATNLLAEQIGAKQVSITESRELQAHDGPHASDRSTRHIELSLAPGQTYAPGDHLSVIPRNPPDLVRRVEKRFDLTATGLIKLQSADGPHASLPVDRPIKLRDLLFEMVELQSPASRRDVELLARHTRCPDTKEKLTHWAGEGFAEEIQGRKVSALDLLEKLPACELPFEVFLETCPNMVPRYYSISSSPKAHPGHCTITVAVVAGPAKGREGKYEGVCSNYLAHLEAGASVQVATRQPSAGFTLPADASTPVIMIGPGTGLAPFRGFMQEREALAAEGTKLGDAMLFFGCRHPEQDFIYEDELKGWDEAGLCTLHTAFSRVDEGRAYVQDLIAKNGSEVWALIEAGAKIYVCGDGGRMEPDVRRTLAGLAAENGAGDGEAFMAKMMSDERYVLDVWVSD
ncbi:MAG: cytochrome P450, partial [Pseudomonadota bacterium]